MSGQLEVLRRPDDMHDLRRRVRAAEDEVFSLVHIPLDIDREVLACATLVANAKLLFTGPPGSAKSLLARLIGRVYCGDGGDTEQAIVTCHQDLTPHDVLFDIDLAALQDGREVVRPKPAITAAFKFFNEIERASGPLRNALLSLLAEGEVWFKRARFRSPDHLCVFDRNPTGANARELPEEFLDRIDYGFQFTVPHLTGSMKIGRVRRCAPCRWSRLDSLGSTVLGMDTLRAVWDEVAAIEIPRAVELRANMLLQAFRLCIKEDRSVLSPAFDLDCSGCAFRGEICGHLEAVPGHRPTESVLKLAQARAWRDGRPAVRPEDLPDLLPYVLGHRLRLRRDLERSVPSAMSWVEDVAVGQILSAKLARWGRAATALVADDRAALDELAENDLVVRELALGLDEELVGELRQEID